MHTSAALHEQTGQHPPCISRSVLPRNSAHCYSARWPPPPGPHSPRPFRAVLNSAPAPYKRLHLAAKVERLAVVGYAQDSDYHSTVPMPPGSLWMNLHSSAFGAGSGSSSALGGSAHAPVPKGTSAAPTSDASAGCGQLGPGGQLGPPLAAGSACNVSAGTVGQPVYLSASQVCAALNRCEVGLALSELEGPCWASTEYLLCGLPVVTTPCSGGREVWYNEGNSIVVQPTQVGSLVSAPSRPAWPAVPAWKSAAC